MAAEYITKFITNMGGTVDYLIASVIDDKVEKALLFTDIKPVGMAGVPTNNNLNLEVTFTTREQGDDVAEFARRILNGHTQ